MLDAIGTGLREMKKAKNSRKAIVVVSDGGDNRSHYTAAQIESLVREADVQIYAMGVFEPVFSQGRLLRKSPGRVCCPKLRREQVGELSQRRSRAICRASQPGSRSNCAISTSLATTRRIKPEMESTARWR